MKIEEEIRQEKFNSPYQKAVINLMYTCNLLLDAFKQVFRPFGITLPQYNVLKILKGKYPDAAYAGEVKRVMLDKSPDLTRLVDRLVEKGLASRKLCEHNRRKVEIKITERGLKLLSDIEPVAMEFMGGMKHISDAESEELSRLLDKLRG